MAREPKSKKRQSKKSHRRNSRLTVCGASGDRCGDTVGFSLSKRRRCKGVSPDPFRTRVGACACRRVERPSQGSRGEGTLLGYESDPHAAPAQLPRMTQGCPWTRLALQAARG